MIEILQGDSLEVLKTLPDNSVQMCVTSPPYFGLRAYLPEGHADKGLEVGLESSVDTYVAKLVEVFREVRRVLKPDGTCWVNLGDSYASNTKGTGGGWANDPNNYAHKAQKYGARKIQHGLKTKNLIGIPWRVAFALQADGWYLRQDLIWHKPNAMPESVKDRCTKSHEYIFLLSKRARYYFNHEAIKEPSTGNLPWGRQSVGARASEEGAMPRQWEKHELSRDERIAKYAAGRNRRSVWSVSTRAFPGAHFAVFPTKLIEPCILAGSRPGDVVLDPFFGSGTTALVARQHGRRCIGIELNADYIQIAQRRLELAADPPEEDASGQPSIQPGLFEAIPA